MFQDYCALHGEPCIPGSLYCCEGCWQEELNNCIQKSESDSELKAEQSSSEKYILYECYKCNSSHESHISCEQAKSRRATHLCFNSYNWNRQKSEYKNKNNNINKPRSCPIEVIQENAIPPEDMSVLKGNQLIMTNYQVWLVNLNSRSL